MQLASRNAHSGRPCCLTRPVAVHRVPVVRRSLRGQSRRVDNRRLSQKICAEPQPADPAPREREDDVLPDNLPDALRQSSEATAVALRGGAQRCIVEILLPEFWDPMAGPIFKEEGDQQRFWKLTKRFIENLASEMDGEKIKAIYPDMGVAAMLANQWEDRKFGIGSLNDRRPVSEDDEIIVLAAPDPPSLQDCMRIARENEGQKPVVLFNPRLVSGEVGVGLNVRRIRDTFLKTFTITYSLRPIGDIGSVFRRYPGLWQVFIEDDETPGRYKLAAERSSRPAGDVLDYILQGNEEGGEEGSGQEPDFFSQLSTTMSSLQRFMRSLSQ